MSDFECDTLGYHGQGSHDRTSNWHDASQMKSSPVKGDEDAKSTHPRSSGEMLTTESSSSSKTQT